MGLFSSNTGDVFVEVVREVAKSSYGMIYIEEDWEKIKEKYIEREDTGGLVLDAKITHREIKEYLDDLAEDENSPIEKVRKSVYFIDLIGLGRAGEEGIDTVTPDLASFFENKAIIDKKTLLDEFGVSRDDDDFFISPLIERDYLKKIKTGADSYYVIGDFLKREYDTQTINEQLKNKSSGGTVSHSELSRVISVEAKEDVINYLETQENMILDLGGDFLILQDSTIEDFAQARAEEICDDIKDTIENAGYLLPVEEVEQYIVEDLESKKESEYPNALKKAENVNIRDEIVETTVESVKNMIELREDDGLYKLDQFEDHVAQKAKSAVSKAHEEQPSSDKEWKEIAMTKIDREDMASSPIVNDHFNEVADEKIDDEIDKRFGGGE